MTSFYGMGKRSEDESNITTKLSSRLVKKHSTVRWLTTVAVIFFALTWPSKAMPGASGGSRMERRSEEPQSTLIAFPRVGRSVSDQEYFMQGDESPEDLDSAATSLNSPVVKFAGSKTRSKRQALIPYPRTGKRSPSIVIPFHSSFGKRDTALIPYPRTGKRVFAPRTGKRSPAVWKRVFTPRTGKRAAFGPRTGKRARAFGPRIGKRTSIHPFPDVIQEQSETVERHIPVRYGTAFDVNQISDPELLQNLQDFKHENSFDSPPDQENSNRKVDGEDHSSYLRSELVDLYPEELGLKDAVRNNDLYQFLHSMLREIAKTQHQNGLTGFTED